jgi:hypothetical protein
MQCANPQCSKELLYLREGRLELLELESHSHDQVSTDDDQFPIKSLPSRFFWLCGECMKTHVIERWTTSGLILESNVVKFAPRQTFSDGQSDYVASTMYSAISASARSTL